MSVVTASTRRRWALVAAGVVVLACVPTVTAAATDWIATTGSYAVPAPRVLLERMLGSDDVEHSGLAESRGNLGLPDLPAIGDVAARLGGSTRTRVWWGGPETWRVDVLTATGEQGMYQHGTSMDLWDYEQNRITRIPDQQVRLPRADDLLPPQAARRLLRGLGPGDRVTGLGAARVIAGVTADGIRVTPAATDSTIGHIDVWLDRDHGLPVAFELVDRHGVTALTSRYTELTFAAPSVRTLQPPDPPGATRDVEDAPDIASRILRFAQPGPLPGNLAGLASSTPVAGGAATYGKGLVRFAVLPLPQRLAGRVLGAARDGGGVASTSPEGESVAFSNSVLSIVIARRDAGGGGYVLAGMVDPALLTRAAGQLLTGAG